MLKQHSLPTYKDCFSVRALAKLAVPRSTLNQSLNIDSSATERLESVEIVPIAERESKNEDDLFTVRLELTSTFPEA